MTSTARSLERRELLPGLLAARADFDGVPLTVYVLLAERPVLIDTGVAITPARQLGPLLESLGSGLGEVGWIVNTHAHHDHVGGNAAVRAASPGARVAVHHNDRGWAESPERYLRELYRESFPDLLRPTPEFEARIGHLFAAGAPVARPFRGGEELDVGGRRLRVIESPAHSPGHVLLEDERAGVLFAGDAIQRRGTEIEGPRGWLFPFYADLAAYRRDLATIRSSGADLVCTAHFGPVRGSELTRLLDDSEELVATLDELLEGLLRERGELSLADAEAALLERWPHYQRGVQTLATAAAHLDALVAAGRASATGAGVAKRWAPPGSSRRLSGQMSPHESRSVPAEPQDEAFVRPPSTQDAVLAELRRRLSTGRLQPGQRLVPDQLATDLGVSRVPIREALKILEGEGQVVYQPRRGYRVVELSLDDLKDLYRMRELLEPEALRTAVANLSDEDVELLLSHLQDSRQAGKAGDLIGWAQGNRRFYLGLVGACARPRLIRTLRQLWDASDPYRALWANSEAHRAAMLEDQRVIVEALESRDAEQLVAAQGRRRERALRGTAELLAEGGSRTPAERPP